MEETVITGKPIKSGYTEAEYRALEPDSSSSVKVFAEDRKAYYKRFVKGDYIPDEDGVAIIIGKLVDVILLGDENEFDEKFFKSTVVNAPTGLMEKFVENLYRITMDSLSTAGEVTREMSDMMLEAYESVKRDKDGVIVAFKKQSYEKTVELFLSTEASTYYKEIRQIRPKGLTVITSSMMDMATRTANQLKASDNTAFLFEYTERFQHFNQLKIDGFEIDGLPLKGMIDKTIVDHKLKLIQPYDLKVTWDVEGFYENYYLKRRSFYQAYIYYKALLDGDVDLGFDYSEYVVLPPIFVVADSAAFYEPLLYKLVVTDLEDAYKGFTHKRKYYEGLKEVIKDLKWAKENNIWNISRENSANNGVVQLNLRTY